jgi:hypothetical protein
MEEGDSQEAQDETGPEDKRFDDDDAESVTMQPQFERIRTGRSARSQKKLEELPGPYDIDRVNTRESFRRVPSRKH